MTMNTEPGRKAITARNRDASAVALVAWGCLALAATFAPPSMAATTWRCGNSYADQPCPDGRRVDPPPAPGEAARRAADEATRRIESRADAMERNRLHAEQATAARNGAVILPDHRVAEAQAREAARLAARRADREAQRRPRSASGRHGRQHAAADDLTAQGGRRRR